MTTPNNEAELPPANGSASSVGKSRHSYKPVFVADTRKTGYGSGWAIQVKLVGFECRYMYCEPEGKPLLFKRAEDRDAKMKELRRLEKQGDLCLCCGIPKAKCNNLALPKCRCGDRPTTAHVEGSKKPWQI